MASISLGQHVSVRGEPGIVRFLGPTQFAPGHWVGVELDLSRGRNDGSVQGVKYFNCEKSGNVGVFIRAEALDKPVPVSPGSLVGPDVKAVVNKLQLKLKAAVAEIGKSKETIAALNAQFESAQRQQEQLEESLEQSTVDVEYLKSHNTELVQLLESLREKYDLLLADYSIVNEELEIHKELEAAVSSLNPLGPISVEDFQTLLQHNKKLELALTSLQKVSEDARNSKAETAKLLNAKSTELATLDKSYQALTQKFEAAGETIMQLREELELSTALALIIDHLTAENEHLKAKITDLTQSVKELTELHEMDKSIEENHMLVEQEFKTLVEKLNTEISSHKRHLDKLQSTNNLLLKELADLKKKLAYDEKPIRSQELEQIILESKKLRLRDSQNSFAKALLQGNVESISEIYGQLVPEKYKSQIKMILLANKSLDSCSSLLSQLKKLPISSPRVKSCFILDEFGSSLSFLKHIAEYAHYNSPEENQKIETFISRLNLNLEQAISLFVPMDLYTLDISFAKEAIDFTVKLSPHYTTLKSAKTDFIYSCIKDQVESSVETVKEISSTYLEGKTKLQTLNEDLMEFLEEGRLLNAQIDKQRKFILENSGKEMVGDSSVTVENVAIAPVLIALFEEIESEVGIEDTDLTEKLTRYSLEFSSTIKYFKELKTILLKQPEFESDDHKSVYHIITEAADGGNENATNAMSELESQLMEKTQKIQDLYLQIELLEKNMSSTLSGKELELVATRNLLSRVRMECSLLKEQSDDLLLANKDLLAQLDVLRSVDHFSEYQQVPAFEDLKSMRDYTSTMALVDEINLLKKMVRHGGNVLHDLNDDWLNEPLTARRKDGRAVSGAKLLQVAQKKRREAVLILKTILANSEGKV